MCSVDKGFKITGSQIHAVQSQWERPKMQLNLVGRLSGGHKCAVLIFLLEPLMDFDVTKCTHVIRPIILSEGLKCALIADLVDLGRSKVIY